MDYKLQFEEGITGFGIFFPPFLDQFNLIFCRPTCCPHVASLRDSAKCKHDRSAHTLCKAAKRTNQRGHTFFPTGPELRQRSILQTVANVRRRKLQVFTNPGEWKGSTSLLYNQTSPISDGIQFTPPERGSLFKHPLCRAANTHNYTHTNKKKNRASCCRLLRRSFKQFFLANSRLPMQLSVGLSILTS